MICKLADQTPSPCTNQKLASLLADLPTNVVEQYNGFLKTEPRLNKALETYLENPNDYQKITPLIMYNEQTSEIVTLMLNNHDMAEDPGEPGSILAYIRANGYDDRFMCSDCYGQLSCSSCAVEVLQGTLENPCPREEEFDMLDIDESKPPTEKTRLGCQARIGTTPLVVKIRAPEKKVISKV
jgi:ferredoxin